jgi:DNA-binding response OmpR family regulator
VSRMLMTDDEVDVVECAGIRLDPRSRRAEVGEGQVDLSPRECDLAEMFMVNAGQVLTRAQLLRHVWDMNFDPGSNVVDVYVGYLRRKLGADSIATVRGLGYRFNR